jgi:MFS family permease
VSFVRRRIARNVRVLTRLPAAPNPENTPSLGKFGVVFWRFLLGQTVSNVGSSLTIFVLPLLVYKLTGSALNLALIYAAEYVPYLLFGLVIGAWVDRVDRRRLMIFVDIMQSIVIFTVPLLAALGLLSVWWIYGVGFVSSTLWICFNTAEFAAIPNLVNEENLVTANGHLQASYSAATVIGPLLAGLLTTVIPIHAILLFDALSFLLSALALRSIETSFNVRDAGQRKPESLRHDVGEGLRYVLGHPVLRNTCFMMALVNCVGFTVYAQLVLFAKERLGASDAEVGLLYAAGGVGMIALALLAGPLRRRLLFNKVALGTLMTGGILIVLLASTRLYWVAVPLWASIWGLVILFDINSNSLWQEVVPNRMLGRVQGTVSMLSWSAIPLGILIGGIVIEQTQNVALVYSAIGILIVLTAIVFSFTAVGSAERYLSQDKLQRPQG